MFSHTKLSNNRSVMPLDVRGCTRATLEESACFVPGPKGLGKPLKILRDWDRELQLFPFNEEFPVSVGHQLTLITSLPFVHTARRCPGLSCFEKCGDRCCGASALRRWKPYLSQWLEPGKSRNKVRLGEPDRGSLSRYSYNILVQMSHSALLRKKADSWLLRGLLNRTRSVVREVSSPLTLKRKSIKERPASLGRRQQPFSFTYFESQTKRLPERV